MGFIFVLGRRRLGYTEETNNPKSQRFNLQFMSHDAVVHCGCAGSLHITAPQGARLMEACLDSGIQDPGSRERNVAGHTLCLKVTHRSSVHISVATASHVTMYV